MIKYDDHTRSPYMTVIYNRHLQRSYPMTVYGDYRWRPSMVIIHGMIIVCDVCMWSVKYDDHISACIIMIDDHPLQHFWRPDMMITYDHHRGWSYTVIICDAHVPISSLYTIAIRRDDTPAWHVMMIYHVDASWWCIYQTMVMDKLCQTSYE